MTHYTTKMPEYAKQVNDICKTLLTLPMKERPWNPYAFVQKNKNSHPEAILKLLGAMVTMWEHIENPWAYSLATLKTLNGQWSERKHAEEKKAWAEYCSKSSRLKDLARGIGDD
jgi:hypothetical protein